MSVQTEHAPMLYLLLHLEPSADEAAAGHAWRDLYVEQHWLPIVGPSSICMARALSAVPAAEVNLIDFGRAIGVSSPSAIDRTIQRMIRFGIMQQTGPILGLPMLCPPVSAKAHARHTPWLTCCGHGDG